MYFLDKYSTGRKLTVLDPFCGRGTVLLEATLRGHKAIGFDMLETALALARVKVQCPAREAVLQEIESLDLARGEPWDVPRDFADLYCFETWGELWNLRESQRSDALTALALGRLHGHSSGFFSAFTFNVVSVRPPALKRLREKHGNEIPYRDVRTILQNAARRFLPEEPLRGDGYVKRADARALPLPAASVDLAITSPPFLDVIDYHDVNWIREWFLKASSTSGAFPDREAYKLFLRRVLQELRRVVKPQGHIVFEVGPVRREARMQDLVIEAAQGALALVEVVENRFDSEVLAEKSVPKISRAMQGVASRGKETTTMTNCCVVLQPLK